MMRRTMLLGLLVVMGCTESNKVASDLLPTDALEIARVDVEQTASRLEVVALDARGAKIGGVVVTYGHFTSLDDGHPFDGLRLEVEANGETATHERAGYEIKDMPMIVSNGHHINLLLKDARVAEVLARNRITFVAVREAVAPPAGFVPAETEQYACTYGGCGFNSCAQTFEYVYDYDYEMGYRCGTVAFEKRCCSNGNAAERRCNYGEYHFENPCGAEGGNGCAVCWLQTGTSSCSAYSSGSQYISCSDSSGSYGQTVHNIYLDYSM